MNQNSLRTADSNAIGIKPSSLGFLRGVSFDMFFIIGLALLAVVAAVICVFFPDPRVFGFILVSDLWVLGYHHVVATFTRLTFDMESFKEHKFLIVWLPWIIVGCSVAGALVLGPWILATMYLYWQWFHYTRQSFGIARIYGRKGDPEFKINPRLEQLTIYLLPLYGILYRSWQNPGYFLGMELKVIPTPWWVVQILGTLSAVVIVAWLWEQVVQYRRGHIKVGYTLFMLSHMIVFLTGYIFIDNINYGWLCMNIWHNAQYVMLVWMFNNNRFKNGIDNNHRFLSTLSQTKNVFFYYGVCLALSTIIYLSLDKILGLISFSALPLAMVAYQSINFHHYVVDGIIWKLRKKPLSQNLGIAEA